MKASVEEMTKFHSDDYIKFLRTIRPDNMSEHNRHMQRCELNPLSASIQKRFWSRELSYKFKLLRVFVLGLSVAFGIQKNYFTSFVV